ncbi:hypothetical protein S245_048863, partial [Arachis hypogaea]
KEVLINAVWLSVLISFCLALTSLGSMVVFQATVLIAVITIYIAYALPIFFGVTLTAKHFVPGAFNLGRVSWLCAYVFLKRKGLKAVTKKEKYDRICEKKLSTPIEMLCKSYPVEFASYFHYCHSLTFDQLPDYGFLKCLFRDLFSREAVVPSSLEPMATDKNT